MFAISTHNIASIPSYEVADAHFKKTKSPPRSTKWMSHQRPLRNVTAPYLRLESHTTADGLRYYDVVLYQTPMLRYFQPNAQGERAVHMQWHYSQSSSKFMWRHGWHSGMTMTADDGEQFELPISNQWRLADELWGDNMTVRLLIDANGRVIKSKSAYIPAFRRTSSATMKARRKAVKEKLSVMLDILEMQHQDILNEVVVDIERGAPFSYRDRDFSYKNLAQEAMISMTHDREPTEDEMTGLVHHIRNLGGEAAMSIANHRLDKVCIDRTQYWRDRYTRSDYVNGGTLHDQPEDLRERITPSHKDVKDRVLGDLMKLCHINEADMREPYPLFGKLPKTWYGSFGEPMDALGADLYHKLVSRKGVTY